jgi:hypothetical protein
MQFEINNIPFLYFNWQYEKELHNKEGKPNQKCGCYFESAKVYDFKILEEWQDIISVLGVIETGKADNLIYENRQFKGKLPIDMPKFGKKLEYKENAKVDLEIHFLFDTKKLFENLFKNKTINIFLKDITGLKELNDLPKGDITFNLIFADPSLALKAKPILTNYQINSDGKSFTIQTNSSILNTNISSIIDSIDCENVFKITKKENHWKYKIDVQHYLWLMGSCDYKETDDLDIVEGELLFNGNKLEKLEWGIFKSDINFIVRSSKKLYYKITKNNSLENPFDKEPFKECPYGNIINGKKAVLDEELPVKIPYEIVVGRKK